MDWKWMIERGGRMTFTVISTPAHTDTPPHPAFLEHTEKPSDIESYSGHFGSTCNERNPLARLTKFWLFLLSHHKSFTVITMLFKDILQFPFFLKLMKKTLGRQHPIDRHILNCVGDVTSTTQTISLKFLNLVQVETPNACPDSSRVATCCFLIFCAWSNKRWGWRVVSK